MISKLIMRDNSIVESDVDMHASVVYSWYSNACSIVAAAVISRLCLHIVTPDI